MKGRNLGFLLLGVLSCCLLIVVFIVGRGQPLETREAPEAGAVMQAQASLPFQVLIPAYLPSGFKRSAVQIVTSIPGPQGQKMVRLTYSHPTGANLVLTEWLAGDQASSAGAGRLASAVAVCYCLNQGSSVCSADSAVIDDGLLRIVGKTSDRALLSLNHVRLILKTLGPAYGVMTYDSLEKAIADNQLPPAEAAKINENGEQQVILVVTPSGYTPVHFSVKKGIPVHLSFHQLGFLNGGNELFLPWSTNEQGHLILSSPGDSQTLTFTPLESGDFFFHCEYNHFQGVMTVTN